MAPAGERWPPVYDADDLAREIKRITEDARLARDFFDWRLDRSVSSPDDICQGDVVLLESDVPVITQDGQPATIEHPEGVWMVIGNTCDFDRSILDARWTQLIPIMKAGKVGEVTQAELSAARRYTQARRFYVPPWSSLTEQEVHIADLLLPVAVDKRVLREPSVRRLSRHE